MTTIIGLDLGHRNPITAAFYSTETDSFADVSVFRCSYDFVEHVTKTLEPGSALVLLERPHAWAIQPIHANLRAGLESHSIPCLAVEDSWSSRVCSECGNFYRETCANLGRCGPAFACECGYADDADFNAAKNLVRWYLNPDERLNFPVLPVCVNALSRKRPHAMKRKPYKMSTYSPPLHPIDIPTPKRSVLFEDDLPNFLAAMEKISEHI